MKTILFRIKTGDQNLVHYIAKEGFFDDYIFSIGYYLTLQDNGQNHNMFPSYKDSVQDGDAQSNSRVSSSFERAWAAIYATAQEYLEDIEELGSILEAMNTFSVNEISQKLVAHGAQKYGIQKLGDLLTCSVQDISMRGGWALKTSNTFFCLLGWILCI